MNLTKSPIHFIGIGGIGMSGIARIILQLGGKVSGTDMKESETTRQLRDMGGEIFIGHDAARIGQDVETVVFSSAITGDNPEMTEAKRRGLQILPRAEMLAQLMARQESIAVAGAHGKTTTTAMISLMLEINGLDPTIIIGGVLKQIGSNAKLGLGKYLVAEADESDGSFLKLFPKMAVITNIENDHLDYYRSVQNIVTAFVQFVEQLPQDGFAVICLDNEPLREIMAKVPANYITYGIEHPDADYRAENMEFSGTHSRSDIFYRGEKLGSMELRVPGRHNVLNALGAIALGLKLGLTFEQAAAGLKEFTGAKRRFDFIDEVAGITVYDDYAHHPTELKATLSAAKAAGFQRTIAIFQPHRYSRTKLLQFEFGESFSGADLVIINEIYSASEKPMPGVSAQLIVRAIKNSNPDLEVVFCATEDEIVEFLCREGKPGDLIITMGAGNIRQAGIHFAEAYRALKGTDSWAEGD
ncbi:UDP-N-acetylmuramate--L-alanine ligase [Dehalobacterium formicoaceticum]|uniref:UDP-N-acetylmuramate--L-alanine ligase n=1 Tax=Dehalobacterium formicoaceticum TaxID=51515 RepID=A0ABT1Y487_9FIRM|nr:UDP-N-acetylmuramate--L-alanine ligase [Dehalobacterium formicoaceticum]MCR6544481.1 UDP-N-acetylmuramate--L-alanine ligase [Dehalobacterium formicoaceticum]